MKIALPVCRDSVAPRFDCTDQFLIVEVQGRRVIQRYILDCPEQNLLKRALLLIQVPVEAILCGRIDNFSLRILQKREIIVINGQYGPIDKALENGLKILPALKAPEK